MHNLLRLFLTASALVDAADENQIDRPGAKKGLGSIWMNASSLSMEFLEVAEELSADSTRATLEPHANESGWLKAFIDELGTPTERAIYSMDDSCKLLTRGIAWFAFCLRDAASYAKDPEYGMAGFEQICEMIKTANADEQALIAVGIVDATLQFDTTGARYTQITETYDQLLACAK